MPKSKFFRVFVEGATSDGRVIQRSWIEQMARNYDRAKYGARVWLEHFRGIFPDGPFRAYGDVTAVKAEEVEIDGEKKLALFAQIDPTPDLVKMTKERQKIFTSAEVSTDFAKTGEAYLVGLAVTDSPASLGTEVLAFAAQNPAASPFTARKQHADNLFTASEEVELAFTDHDSPAGESLLSRVKELFGRKGSSDDKRFADVAQAVEEVAQAAADLRDTAAELSVQYSELAAQVEALQASSERAVADLAAKIDHTEAPDPKRPPASGGNGAVVTDC